MYTGIYKFLEYISSISSKVLEICIRLFCRICAYMCVYVRICAYMLDIQQVAKIANIGKKKIYKKFANPENLRTFVFGNVNKAVPKAL